MPPAGHSQPPTLTLALLSLTHSLILYALTHLEPHNLTFGCYFSQFSLHSSRCCLDAQVNSVQTLHHAPSQQLTVITSSTLITCITDNLSITPHNQYLFLQILLHFINKQGRKITQGNQVLYISSIVNNQAIFVPMLREASSPSLGT